jgi:hypothetical protein
LLALAGLQLIIPWHMRPTMFLLKIGLALIRIDHVCRDPRDRSSVRRSFMPVRIHRRARYAATRSAARWRILMYNRS